MTHEQNRKVGRRNSIPKCRYGGMVLRKRKWTRRRKEEPQSRLRKQNLNHAPLQEHPIITKSLPSQMPLSKLCCCFVMYTSSGHHHHACPWLTIGLDAGHGCHLDSFPSKRQQHRSCEADFLRVPTGIFCLPKIRRTIIEMRQPVQQLSIRV